ncbi:ABC transporter ATP-binding protein [Kineococcus sp. GCM10028916]|uniref:ABC transporter ATP-binding protein n=1 Tax=Kineococcus sp. GCM10028916 TaxID=3273394 RepID=UPI0036431C03
MDTTHQPRLELIEITKVYANSLRAVDEVTLDLRPGIIGLLGPNGAGKSSLMRVMATVTRPTSGQVRFEGVDVLKNPDVLRTRLGYLPQDFGVYPHLTSREFLTYLAAAKGLSARSARARIDELLELLNLTAALKRPLGKYSGGMMRRVGIAQALLGDPRVIVVDEPTAGLDPEERARFRDLLSELAATRIVVLSTHIVSDVESVASDIAIVTSGRLQRRGTVPELLEQARGRVWEVLVEPGEVADLRSRYTVSRALRSSSGVQLRLLGDVAPRDAVAVAPELEDVYLDVTARRCVAGPAPVTTPVSA